MKQNKYKSKLLTIRYQAPFTFYWINNQKLSYR